MFCSTLGVGAPIPGPPMGGGGPAAAGTTTGDAITPRPTARSGGSRTPPGKEAPGVPAEVLAAAETVVVAVVVVVVVVVVAVVVVASGWVGVVTSPVLSSESSEGEGMWNLPPEWATRLT